MRVIFLQDVQRVGKRNDIKEVNNGYAMNFLIPRKLAMIASPQAIADLQARSKTIEIEREVQNDLLIRNLEEIKGKVVHMKGRANEKGSLFSAIHEKEIAEAMKAEHRADIDPEFIVLEKPVKETGEFDIPISIKGKESSFKLIIEALK